jgi:hypothetical protein
MLGIAGGYLITPDYNKPFKKVLLDFATGGLLAGQLSLLHESSLGPQEFSSCSFVPCLFSRTTQPFSLEDTNPEFRAGGRQPPAVRSICPESVAIRGVQVGTIVASVGFITGAHGFSLVSDPHLFYDEHTNLGGFISWSQFRKTYSDCKKWIRRQYSLEK